MASVSDYMTVGEVAERVGVTVRSIQYYDQQGILSPSAKGPQNQRLYTPEDVDRLYCVLTLKYAGLSLAQIRECLKGGRAVSTVEARQVFVDALRETEDAFSSLLSRYAALRSLAETLGSGCPSAAPSEGEPFSRGGSGMPSLGTLGYGYGSGYGAGFPEEPNGCDGCDGPCDDEPDWCALATAIERFQGEGKYFWRLSCVYDEGDAEQGQVAFDKGRVVTEWHGFIAEVIRSMGEGEPLDSERNQDLARRFLRLHAEDVRRPSGQHFLLLENAPASNREGDDSFAGMRRNVNDYIKRLMNRYAELHPEEGWSLGA